MSPWVYLCLAGAFEMSLALGLKFCKGFTRFWPSLLTIFSTFISFYSLSQAVKVLPIGLAYAIWTGIGALGVTLIGFFFLHESLSLVKVLCILLITAGMIGLKFT